MFDSKEELLEKITLGEDTLLELKGVRFRGKHVDGPSRDDLADELAALANTHDAVLVLGVEDKTLAISGIPPRKSRFGRDVGARDLSGICGSTVNGHDDSNVFARHDWCRSRHYEN